MLTTVPPPPVQPSELRLTLRRVAWHVVVSHGAVVNLVVALVAAVAPLLVALVEAVLWLYVRPAVLARRAHRTRRAAAKFRL